MPELTLPQGAVHYRDEGDGPAVVFIHGALVNGRLWEPVVERLASEREVMRLLGRGEADVGMFAQVARQRSRPASRRSDDKAEATVLILAFNHCSLTCADGRR